MNSESKVWKALEGVQDPEIPSVSILEMGMVQGVEVQAKSVRCHPCITKIAFLL